jgi:hypothetical protein
MKKKFYITIGVICLFLLFSACREDHIAPTNIQTAGHDNSANVIIM